MVCTLVLWGPTYAAPLAWGCVIVVRRSHERIRQAHAVVLFVVLFDARHRPRIPCDADDQRAESEKGERVRDA